MSNRCRIRKIGENEIEQVCTLISEVFDEFIAPLQDQKGIDTFYSIVNPQGLKQKLEEGGFILTAEVDGAMAGIAGIRDNNHLFLLFIKKEYQGKGIGRELVQRAITECLKSDPDINELTVNSSPNAVPVYKRIGFIPTSVEQVKEGLRYTPMVLDLDR